MKGREPVDSVGLEMMDRCSCSCSCSCRGEEEEKGNEEVKVLARRGGGGGMWRVASRHAETGRDRRVPCLFPAPPPFFVRGVGFYWRCRQDLGLGAWDRGTEASGRGSAGAWRRGLRTAAARSLPCFPASRQQQLLSIWPLTYDVSDVKGQKWPETARELVWSPLLCI